jgi:hypothetical protein
MDDNWHPEYLENSNRLLRRRVEYFQEKAQTAEEELEAIRKALNGYEDSNLVSLSETVVKRSNALETERGLLRADIARLQAEKIRLWRALNEMYQTMLRYEMEAPGEPPYRHKEMMRRAYAALGEQEAL